MYINGLKYACSSCIKGHRSSQCNHADRPLIEIRKKGRPITQCSFCRDLRKNHQVHIKCICNNSSHNGHDKKEQQQVMTLQTASTTPPSLFQQQQQAQTEHANDCTTIATTSSVNTAAAHQQCACLSKLLGTTTKQIIPFISATSSSAKATETTLSSPLVDHNHSQKSMATQDGSSTPAPLCPTTTSTTTVLSSSNSYCCAPDGGGADLSELQPSSSSSVTSDYTYMLDSLPSAVDMINIASSSTIGINKEAIGESSKIHHHFQHKPISSNATSKRFLEGQPRIRTTGAGSNANGIHRRKSATKWCASSSTFVVPSQQQNHHQKQQQQQLPTPGLFIDTLTTATTIKSATDESLSTPPPSIASPHSSQSLTTGNSAFCDNLAPANNLLDMQFDYLTEQLEILSNNHNNSNNNNNHGQYADLFNTTQQQQQEEDAFFNTMLSTSVVNNNEMDEDTAMIDVNVTGNGILSAITTTATTMTATTTTTINASATTPVTDSTTTTIIQFSQCGSFIPHSNCTQAMCATSGSNGSSSSSSGRSNPTGESVVITITPLSDHPNSQSNITTRIVTCYCGQQCMCPGCLVHPHQQFIFNNNNDSLATTNNSSRCSEE